MSESPVRPDLTHGTRTGYKKRRCRCDACRAWAKQENRRYRARHPEALQWAKRWRLANPEKAAETNKRWRQANRDRQRAFQRKSAAKTYAASLERATRRGQPWTGPELEIVARVDLTAPQVAAMISRTVPAVNNMRQNLRDPLNPSARMLADGPTPPTAMS